MRQIYGMVMRPCSTTEEGNEEVWKSSEFYTEKNFMDEYRKHMIGMEHVAECAKIYILKNWEKIEDWTGLDVTILDNTGKKTEYFNYRPLNEKIDEKRSNSGFVKILREMNELDKKKHRPIKRIKDVVLDPTDGDFSLTINRKNHLWIDNDSVIVIANFIETKLNEK